jgi:quercetin dioxygenase-like cupin family protein
VKKIEAIAIGTDVRARLFTLAPAEVIPGHHQSESTDHYFVLRAALTIETRHDDRRELKIGERHQIRPGTTHLISNRGAEDCEFLLVQGVGKYDWIKAES